MTLNEAHHYLFSEADEPIEGNAGTNTLRIDGSNVKLNLSTTNTETMGVEVINLEGSAIV